MDVLPYLSFHSSYFLLFSLLISLSFSRFFVYSLIIFLPLLFLVFSAFSTVTRYFSMVCTLLMTLKQIQPCRWRKEHKFFSFHSGYVSFSQTVWRSARQNRSSVSYSLGFPLSCVTWFLQIQNTECVMPEIAKFYSSGFCKLSVTQHVYMLEKMYVPIY
jgi:hypothetical protein